MFYTVIVYCDLTYIYNLHRILIRFLSNLHVTGFSSCRITIMIHSCLVCVCVCVYMCKHVSLRVSVFESLSAYLYVCIFHIFNNLLYSIPCLSLATKTLTSSHFLILTSTHNEHIHMISSNILMNIFMQVFGVCKSYNYITHLSTYTPTRSRANHRLVFWANFETKTTGFDGLRRVR